MAEFCVLCRLVHSFLFLLMWLVPSVKMKNAHRDAFNLTEVFTFFFKPLLCMNCGPGMQLTTAAMPPSQENVALGLLNSRGQAARWTSVPVHATE